MKILFAGTPEVAATVLRKLSTQHEIVLVLTRPDAQVGRKKISTPSPVAKVAEGLGISVMKSNNVGPRELAAFEAAKIDRAIVVAYGSVIPQTALNLFPWWNLHFSVLPAWRGATPLQHSLLFSSGQGLSLFELDASLDTGSLVEVVEMTLPTDKTAGEIMRELAPLGADLIARNLARSTTPTKQLGEVSYAPKIRRTEARLDFSDSAPALQRKVLALNPEPMAWCRAGGKDVRVLRTRALGSVDWNSLSEQKLAPGEIEVLQGRVLVGCGDGSRLELLEVQPAGGRPMTGAEWQRGFGGDKFE